jgi:glycosyltransferase involved in cell wall biosynthesis
MLAPRTISVALLTHNETPQFHWLMQTLTPALPLIHEIVVVDDFSDDDCVAAIRSYEGKLPLRFFQRSLEQNFARQRNHMKSLCQGEFIFYLDPDELPSDEIVFGLPRITEMMTRENVDACTLPRFNFLYESDQQLHPRSFDLNNLKHKSHWEDQFRILRNTPDLYWTMPLNEYLTGMRRCYRFPQLLRYALLHPKNIEHGTKQQQFYKSFRWRNLNRYKNSIAKRLPWRPRIEWIATQPPI